MSEAVLGKRFLRSGEVERVLKRSRKQVRALVREKKLTAKWIGAQWRYPAAEVRALAQRFGFTSEEQGEGGADATAIGLIREGRSDGEVVERCALPLREVERLRLSLGLTPTADVRRAAVSAATATDEEISAGMRPGISRARAKVDEMIAEMKTFAEQARRRAYGEK